MTGVLCRIPVWLCSCAQAPVRPGENDACAPPATRAGAPGRAPGLIQRSPPSMCMPPRQELRRECHNLSLFTPTPAWPRSSTVASPRRSIGWALAQSALIGVLGVALGGVSAALARADSPATCRSGHTLFHQRGIRAFSLERVDRSDPRNPLPHQVIYACLPGERRPQVLYDGDVGTFTSANSFALSGNRLGFLARQEGGVAEDSSFGWVNIRTRVVKLGQFNVASPENSPGDPVAPDAEVHFAIAPDGTAAVIGSDGRDQEVLLMRALPRSLGKPRELGSSSTGDIKVDSIAITPTTVNWTTTAGVRHTVPR
jgi:hypothetical protein